MKLPLLFMEISYYYEWVANWINELPLEIFLFKLEREYANSKYGVRDSARIVKECKSTLSLLEKIETENKAVEKKGLVFDLSLKAFKYAIAVAATKVIAERTNLKNVTNQIKKLEPSFNILGADLCEFYGIYVEFFERISDRNNLNAIVLKQAVEKAIERSKRLKETYQQFYFGYLPGVGVHILTKKGKVITRQIKNI